MLTSEGGDNVALKPVSSALGQCLISLSVVPSGGSEGNPGLGGTVPQNAWISLKSSEHSGRCCSHWKGHPVLEDRTIQ